MAYKYIINDSQCIRDSLITDIVKASQVIYDSCANYFYIKGIELNGSRQQLSPSNYVLPKSGLTYQWNWETTPSLVLNIIRDILDNFINNAKEQIMYINQNDLIKGFFDVTVECVWNTLRIYGKKISYINSTPSIGANSIIIPVPPHGDGRPRHYSYEQKTDFYIKSSTIVYSNITKYGLKSIPLETLNNYKNHIIQNFKNLYKFNIGEIISAKNYLDFLEKIFIYNDSFVISIEDIGNVETVYVCVSESQMEYIYVGRATNRVIQNFYYYHRGDISYHQIKYGDDDSRHGESGDLAISESSYSAYVSYNLLI